MKYESAPVEFRSLLPDLLAALMPNIIAKGLVIGHLGDLNTLKERLDQELDKENSFASYVALIGAFGHNKSIHRFPALAPSRSVRSGKSAFGRNLLQNSSGREATF